MMGTPGFDAGPDEVVEVLERLRHHFEMKQKDWAATAGSGALPQDFEFGVTYSYVEEIRSLDVAIEAVRKGAGG